MKKSVIAFVVLALLVAMPLASAGLWQWLTGHDVASSLPTDVNVDVGNTAPVVSSTAITPDPAYKANTLNCTTSYSDHDTDTGTVNFTWYNGSTFYSSEVVSSVATGTTASVLLTPGVQSKGETWNCTVFANDGTDNSAPSSDTITISNTAPTIPWVESISAVSPTENSVTAVPFKFTAQDNDGYGDLSDGTALARFTYPSEALRSASCSATGGEAAGNYKNYSCSVNMQFYDKATAGWNVNVSIADLSAARAENTSTSFTYNSLTAFTLIPSPLTWGPLTPGATDQGATNDPSVLTNTGNYESTNIRINATDLNGTTPGFKSYTIATGNFTANVADSPSGGDQLITSTYQQVTSAALPKGASSVENIYYYLDVPSTTVRQSYTTDANGAWTIKIA